MNGSGCSSGLPQGIEQAYAEAVQRTGETAELRRARATIVELLKAGPVSVEILMAVHYQRND